MGRVHPRHRGPELELLPEGEGSREDRLRRYVREIPAGEWDFVTVVVPES